MKRELPETGKFRERREARIRGADAFQDQGLQLRKIRDRLQPLVAARSAVGAKDLQGRDRRDAAESLEAQQAVVDVELAQLRQVPQERQSGSRRLAASELHKRYRCFHCEEFG